MKKNIFFLLFIIECLPIWSSKIDTISIFSSVMQKNIPTIVITPTIQNSIDHFPVVYLLHGYSGNYMSWIKIKPNLGDIADRDGIIFVCPDGENSWYWDSPINPKSCYETFISKELIHAIDLKYNTIPTRKGRAITGLSMGGEGAFWNAIKHKDIFGAVGSTSGGLDIRPFANNWEMKNQLGDQENHKTTWEEYTIYNQIDSLKNGDLAIIFDCGDKDFFLEINENLHKKLLKKGINHDFIVRPGTHNQSYWNNSIDYQILFFKKYFNNKVISK